jgi:hypothetical protein
MNITPPVWLILYYYLVSTNPFSAPVLLSKLSVKLLPNSLAA